MSALPIVMTEHDVVIALAWIIGIGTSALGAILWALATWIVKRESLRTLIDKEMRAFDVRLATLETIIGMREGNGAKHRRRIGDLQDRETE